jgi:hypothetical protein
MSNSDIPIRRQALKAFDHFCLRSYMDAVKVDVPRHVNGDISASRTDFIGNVVGNSMDLLPS